MAQLECFSPLWGFLVRVFSFSQDPGLPGVLPRTRCGAVMGMRSCRWFHVFQFLSPFSLPRHMPFVFFHFLEAGVSIRWFTPGSPHYTVMTFSDLENFDRTVDESSRIVLRVYYYYFCDVTEQASAAGFGCRQPRH